MHHSPRSLRAEIGSCRPVFFWTLALAALVIVLGAYRVGDLAPAGIFKDFNAFYCAGSAVAAGADPYLAEPIGSCEALAKPWNFYSTPPHLVYPAPLPGYALVAFAGLARLPFAVAAILWTIVLAAAFTLTIAATRALVGGRVGGIVAAYALVDGYAAFALGQIAPLAVLGLVLAAYAARRDRVRLAVLGLGIAAIEPHLAVPAAFTLVLFRPRFRVPLACLAIGLAALSVSAVGFERNQEYFTRVLPAHTLAEAANEKQFSLTHALWSFGVPARFAARLGDLSYAIMSLLGALAGRRAFRRTGDGAYLVALPSLFLLVGGPFVHIVQMSAAVPAALLLRRDVPKNRTLLAIAVLLLAVPWMQFVNLGSALPFIVGGTCATLTWYLIDRAPIAIAGAALGATALLTIMAMLATVAPGPTGPALAAIWDPHALAEVSWQKNVEIVGTVDFWAFFLSKLATWTGLAIVVACALRLGDVDRSAPTGTDQAPLGS